jgi:hypothetical protein
VQDGLNRRRHIRRSRRSQNDALVRELLKTLCDAIAAYRSLLKDEQILYRGVRNNIIITNSATNRGPRGRLIDLDLAKGVG